MKRLLSYLLGKNIKQDKETEQIEDILKAFYHAETESQEIDINALCTMAQIKDDELQCVLQRMIDEDYIAKKDYKLTDKGKRKALHIIRRHRLYETYLSKHSGYDSDKWHQMADTIEHSLSEEETDRLSRMLGNPLYDPHGDPIPRKDAMEIHSPHPKSDYKIKKGDWVVVAHIEDNNKEKYAVLSKMGIAKGVVFQIEDENPLYIEIFLCGNVIKLRRDLLTIIDICLASEKDVSKYGGKDTIRLSALKEGEKGIVKSISSICAGTAKRRLMDLGFVSGSEVSVDVHSPMGNPTAYLVRGTAIALRRDQADYILIKRLQG